MAMENLNHGNYLELKENASKTKGELLQKLATIEDIKEGMLSDISEVRLHSFIGATRFNNENLVSVTNEIIYNNIRRQEYIDLLKAPPFSDVNEETTGTVEGLGKEQEDYLRGIWRNIEILLVFDDPEIIAAKKNARTREEYNKAFVMIQLRQIIMWLAQQPLTGYNAARPMDVEDYTHEQFVHRVKETFKKTIARVKEEQSRNQLS